MNFTYGYGTTRFVLLIGTVAVKFSRIPLLLLIRRGLFWLKQGKFIERPRELYGSLSVGIAKYLLAGIMANSDEYRFYQEFPNLPLAPTLGSFLGLVNIQVRGGVVDASELADCPFRDIAEAHPKLDFFKAPRQFCRINGQIVLADYGDLFVQNTLRKKYAKTAVVFA